MNKRLHAALSRLYVAWLHKSHTLVLSVSCLLTGPLAIFFGDQVSQALTNISAEIVAQGMGVALLAGALCCLYGIASNRSLMELVGMGGMALGIGVYGLGVILGLGLGGMIAGPLALGVATATVRRIITLATLAHDLSAFMEEEAPHPNPSTDE